MKKTKVKLTAQDLFIEEYKRGNVTKERWCSMMDYQLEVCAKQLKLLKCRSKIKRP